jgi:hypothetical protein
MCSMSLKLDVLDFLIIFINILKFIPNLFSCVATHHLLEYLEGGAGEGGGGVIKYKHFYHF